MDCQACKKCDKLEQHKWRANCTQCGCTFYKHSSYLDSEIFNKQILEASLESKEHWIAPQYHPHTSSLNQLSDYHSAIAMARECQLIWLPIGLQLDEVEEFHSIWKSINPPYGLSALDDDNNNDNDNSGNNIKKRGMLFTAQIPLSDWMDNYDGNHNENNLNFKFNSDENIAKSRSDGHSPDSIEESSLTSEYTSNFKKTRDTTHFGFGEVEKVSAAKDDDDGSNVEFSVCKKCQLEITEQDKFVVRITHCATASWHIGCFRCLVCSELLFDYHYCWDDIKHQIYCVRHFGELKYNRCAGCDLLIFDKDFTKAMAQEFHVEHFACSNCDNSLTGDRYILREEAPYCLDCFNSKFTHNCARCSEKISCDSKDLSFNNRHWHDKCFHCDSCSKTLVDKTFGTKDDNIYCPDCYESKFTPHCDACDLPFKSGSKKFEYNKKQWHEECFKCDDCHKPIGLQSFIPRPTGGLSCLGCYESNYAQKCSKCSQIIRKGGVTYREEPWHKECFVCSHCETQLSNVKFTSRENKPYCTDCFTKLFSRRCKKCEKPISGFGGCKYISLENDNWHTECFVCSQCSTTLVGKGFLNHDTGILCPECYKAKSNNK